MLDSAAPYYRAGLGNRLCYELTFNDYNRVTKSGVSSPKVPDAKYWKQTATKESRDLVLGYVNIEIKQYSKVTYLGCILDDDLSGESMATKVLSLVHSRPKFLYRKQKILTLPLRRLLCNAVIQPHYDYACPAWYPSLNKRLSKKIQTSQNKCIRYCLNLDNRAHVGIDEFIKINWPPTKERVAQCISVIIFKFFEKMSLQYMSEIFYPSHSRYNTPMTALKLHLNYTSIKLPRSKNHFLSWTKNME